MSRREVLLVLSHTMNCHACRTLLVENPDRVFRGRSLTEEERQALSKLKDEEFITAELLARGSGVTVDELREYQDHPVARLRHF